jgi:Ca2+-dependent lipid-binding protein
MCNIAVNSFRFVRAEGLMAADLGRTSDPYCVIRFVTDRGIPVSANTYKTKTAKKTLNPVWNEQVVFGADSGFLRAAFAHIEVRTNLRLLPWY